MNLPGIDHHQMRRIAPATLLAAALALLVLLLLMIAAQNGGETGFISRAASVFGGLVSIDFPLAVGSGSWIASQGVAGTLALFVAVITAFGLASLAMRGSTVTYWMKRLFHAGDAAERRVAARELGHAKDSGALLALIDVAEDEAEQEDVRKTAAGALHEMGGKFRKQARTIAALESALGKSDPGRVIDRVTADFEKTGARCAQSAFVIGRQYMKLGQYADAREWLKMANIRDRKSMLYGNRIDRLIIACNERLLSEGDAFFAAGDYQGAREHYALLSHGLDDREKRHFAIFLRSACVYCKLNDYTDADQAVLQALRFDQETDQALTLINLLQKLPNRGTMKRKTDDAAKQIIKAIDEWVTGAMQSLRTERSGTVMPFA